MATLSEIASIAGVSIATVSYALSGKGNISDDTKQRIISIADELGYKTDTNKPFTQTNQQSTIALVVNSFTLPFYGILINHIEYFSQVHKCFLNVYNTPKHDEAYLDRIFTDKSIMGYIVLSSFIKNSDIQRYSQHSAPIILLDRIYDIDNVWSVLVDNEKGAFDATEHLINSGCSKIGFMGTSSDDYEISMRYKGYCSALRKHGISPSDQLFCQGEHTQGGGYNTAKAIIMRGELPEAIFCTNDEMALGLMDACKNANIRIPEDLSIVGFDDVELAAKAEIPLTTIRQPLKDLANAALQALIMAAKHNNHIKVTTISPKLIVRDSVRKTN